MMINMIKQKHLTSENICLFPFLPSVMSYSIAVECVQAVAASSSETPNREIGMAEYKLCVGIIWEVPLVIPSFALFRRNILASRTDTLSDLGPLLLTWFNFNSSMDK